VVEAARKSGAMITANQAFQYGREVYALPGALYQPMSAGPNRLIAEDIARLVVDAEHLVSSFYPIWAKKEPQIDLSQALEGLLIQHFPHGRKVHSAYLKSKLNVSNSRLFKSLQVLLDLGVIAKIGPHTYVRKTAGH
jgi:predicted Rossmann fold nucleotide-binding protein DprA/Smf involved in DNA uptake